MKFNYPNPEDISSFCKVLEDDRMPAGTVLYEVKSFMDMVKLVAHLHFKNQNYLLLYRGQKELHVNKNNRYSFYPSIYRGTGKHLELKPNELKERFKALDRANGLMKKYLPEKQSEQKVLYSLIQHYEITGTPFLDLTHSLQVAFSFARMTNPKECYIAIFGLPHLQGNQILYKQRPNIVNIPLLFNCPSETLRPYFQEAYSLGLNILVDDNKGKAKNDQQKNLISIVKLAHNKKDSVYQLSRQFLQLDEEPLFITEIKKAMK